MINGDTILAHNVASYALMVNAEHHEAMINRAAAGLQDSMGFMGVASQQHNHDVRDSAAAGFPALLQQKFRRPEPDRSPGSTAVVC